jgi:hypothetical protein
MTDLANLNPVERVRSDRTRTQKVKRLIGWVIFGVLLSLVPIVVGVLADGMLPGCNERISDRSFIDNFSGAELLTVAFTLSCASSVASLTNAWNSVWNYLIGGITLLMTLLTMAAYVGLKAGFCRYGLDFNIDTVQTAFPVTIFLAFICELSTPG